MTNSSSKPSYRSSWDQWMSGILFESDSFSVNGLNISALLESIIIIGLHTCDQQGDKVILILDFMSQHSEFAQWHDGSNMIALPFKAFTSACLEAPKTVVKIRF